MSGRDELDEVIDAWLDGSLDEAGREALLKKLDSPEVRKRLARATVTQRLLDQMGKAGVDSGHIMNAIRASGARRHGRAGTGQARSPLPAFILVALLGAVIGIVAWRQLFPPDVPPPDAPPGRPVMEPPVKPAALVQEPVTPPPLEPKPAPAPPPKEPSWYFSGLPQALPETITITPPSGDGSKESGFVAPPESWLKDRKSERLAEEEPGAIRKPAPPVLWVKMRKGESRKWDVTPMDVPNLLGAMTERIGLRYGTEVRSLEEVDVDPAANPVLYFSTHYHFVFSPEERAKLRRFLLAGGMVIFNAGLGSKPAYDSARRELSLILPELSMHRLSPDHPIFHAVYDLHGMSAGGEQAWLEGVTLSCRTAAVISRWGLSAGWAGKPIEGDGAYKSEDALKLGVNLFSYASAARAWTKKAAHRSRFEEWDRAKSSAMYLAQVMHDGDWHTRHSALPLLMHTFNRRTEIPVKFNVRAVRLTDPEIFNDPLLYLSGHEPFVLSAEEQANLRRYLVNGGCLFAEACCGRNGFDRSFRRLMRNLFPDRDLTRIPPDSVIFREPNKISLLGVTPSLAAKSGSMLMRPHLETLQVEEHTGVIYSPFGLAGGWEMSQMPFADGYEDPDALKLGQNILMYVITQ